MDSPNRRQRHKNSLSRSDKFEANKYTKNTILCEREEIEYGYIERKELERKNDKQKAQVKEESIKFPIKSNEKMKEATSFIFEDSDDGDQESINNEQCESEIEEKKKAEKKEMEKVFVFNDDNESEEDQEEVKVNLFEENDKQEEKNKNHQKDISREKKRLEPETYFEKNTFVEMQLWREKKIFNSNLYFFHLSTNHRMVIVAKQTSFGFILSRSVEDFEENSPNYVGKGKLNFSHKILNLFGRGLKPSDARARKQAPRQIVLTLETHSNELMENAKPREFSVFYLNAGCSYRELHGVNDDEPSLKELFEKYSNNKEKISYFTTRKSKWSQNQKMHYLNMKGRAKLPSIKNFILENPMNQGVNILLFGKVEQNLYNIDIHYPLNVFRASAIVLSSFLCNTW